MSQTVYFTNPIARKNEIHGLQDENNTLKKTIQEQQTQIDFMYTQIKTMQDQLASLHEILKVNTTNENTIHSDYINLLFAK